MTAETETSEGRSEQLLYARVLEIGMFLGLAVLSVTFALYVFGALPPAVPLEKIPNYWHHGVHEYLEAINEDYLHREQPATGWTWVTMLGKSDFLNFIGIATLAGVTIICYLAIVPGFLRKQDYVYGTMALIEVVVLTLAASGIVALGH